MDAKSESAPLGSLAPEKLADLRGAIDEFLRSQNVYAQLRSALGDHLSSGSDDGKSPEQRVAEALEKQGVVERLVQGLQSRSSSPFALSSGPAFPTVAPPLAASSGASASKAGIAPSSLHLSSPHASSSGPHLLVSFLRGRAFLEASSHDDDSDSSSSAQGSRFILCCQFGQQRFRGRAQPCITDPPFDDSFVLRLPKPQPLPGQQVGDLLSCEACTSLRLHVVVIRIDADDTATFVGSHMLEWRKVLKSGSVAMSVELGTLGAEISVPAGILELRLELLPEGPSSLSGQQPLPIRGVTEDQLQQQLSKERQLDSDKSRDFVLQAKQWWSKYMSANPDHRERGVKVFARAEDGVVHPVTWFVSPMAADRLLDTPNQAARFVALIHSVSSSSISAESMPTASRDIWYTNHTFLCKRQGGVENHATLLCSLLLGFGLDAYVCLGTDRHGAPHAWVMTRPEDYSSSSNPTVTFWESLSGNRQTYPNPTSTPRYTSISCVFRHDCFFANAQASTSLVPSQQFTFSFEFEDVGIWTPIPRAVLTAVPSQMPTPLAPPSLDRLTIELQLEASLRSLISDHRSAAHGVSTKWDDQLGYVVGQALYSYEMERVTGASTGSDDFQQCVRRIVPEGYTFQGFPIQFSHLSAKRMMASLHKSRICQDIMAAIAGDPRFCVRVRAFIYPEDCVAVWCMVAVRFRAQE